MGIKKTIYWDCRETAKGYVNIASILSGFAFASVVLVLTVEIKTAPTLEYLKDWASIAFLLSFYGCIISTFVFSLIAGEGNISARAFSLMFIGGGGFAVATGLLFWGVYILMSILPHPKIINISYWIFISVIIYTIFYLVSAINDTAIAFGSKTKSKGLSIKSWLKLISPSILCFIILFIQKMVWPLTKHQIDLLFDYIMIIILVLLTINGIFVAFAGSFEEDYQPSIYKSSGWISLHTFAFVLLLMITPQ